MAGNDSFDILDQLGDSKKVKNLKAKLEKKGKSNILGKLDKIEAEIEKAASSNRSGEDIVSNIVDAEFDSLNQDVNDTERDLQELMLHLRSMLDSCGGEFEQLQELNGDELKLIEKSKQRLKDAEMEKINAQNMPNIANLLFGMKNRKVKKSMQAYDQAETGIKQTEEEANRLYRARLQNADIKDSLNRIISQVSGMTNIIENMIVDVVKQIDALKTRKELAFETKQKAATIMEERKGELDNLEIKLKNAENELVELDNNSPEYTNQQKKIADLREERAELKGKYNIALGILQSKERFVDQIVVHLEAQTTTKNNLKQLIGQLKSDTEERIATYESGLQLIQSATAQEAASIYEDAGTKTDQKLTEIAAKVFVSSEKDRIERIKKHPERMSELHKVLVAMATATAKYKSEDVKLMAEHAKKYGIDIKEQFSFSHEDDNKTSESVEEQEKKDESSVNDLMD